MEPKINHSYALVVVECFALVIILLFYSSLLWQCGYVEKAKQKLEACCFVDVHLKLEQ